ncbi:AzlC family ABC transporter permease [Anaerotalea alkaliphila]|uniref:AzlC family ABC transporter permease n=1 Tax=Anaerotalea alkaliphila TaxID=2662126 RepID=A0A7X5HVX6_9FIRM|nr:AzlC family ABC transporter permease [Anaerotalea alkaliphila]NDL67614.1 AzlC family ABC transporter permease [Anaerotalea alkaliphila]
MKNDFSTGLRHGVPIGLGYISVSFTYGILAAGGGMPIGLVVLMSMTNLTSAGQFAGTLLLFSSAGYLELLLATMVINSRYALMSLSLAQKVSAGLSRPHRALMSFGITDETFTVASLEEKEVTFPYMAGLMSIPYLGWALGTFLGAAADALLTPRMQSAAGIALYGMFIALVLPVAKRSRDVLLVVLLAVAFSTFFRYAPFLQGLGGGYSMILSAAGASLAGAWLFPKEVEEVA